MWRLVANQAVRVSTATECCFHEVWQRGNALGCPPYRVNIVAMATLVNHLESVYWNAVAKVKAALDPNNILSPGRYSPNQISR
jgi:4-cresol dehydrogenase (hydroxylating) flavoprotein subunit